MRASLVGKPALFASLLAPFGGLDVRTDRRLLDRLPVETESKKAAQSAEALALFPRPEFPAHPEQIDIDVRELVDHDVAATLGVCSDLLGERAVLRRLAGSSPRRLAAAAEQLAGWTTVIRLGMGLA